MSRKPIHLTLVDGQGPRQQIWDAIRSIAVAENGRLVDGAVFTSDKLIRITDVNKGITGEYLKGLLAAGFIELTSEPVRAKLNQYRLIRDNGIEAPRVRRDGSPVTQGLAQEQMWRALRNLKCDTNARELAALASTTTVPVDVRAAESYLENLYRASYLNRTIRGQGLGKPGASIPSRYRLVSNTGPKPPMVQRTDAIFDPNLNAVVWIKPLNEEACIYGQ